MQNRDDNAQGEHDNAPKRLYVVGDVVRLKGDGPQMTVTAISANVQCAWFCSSGELRTGGFPAEALFAID